MFGTNRLILFRGETSRPWSTTITLSVLNAKTLFSLLSYIVYLIDGNKVIFIRNVYKTAKKYGQKKNMIAVKKFADMVKQLLGDADTKPLFSRKNGEHITPASIASYVRGHRLICGLFLRLATLFADRHGGCLR